ncbi:amidase [Amycolatopsis jejuensis]|uniref:amidase n=1 Tax=Amycolatopsis jejuensis TaxID=330084 RepID=UPI00052422A0|nr:amidase [Amycolatopsis jejuensis]
MTDLWRLSATEMARQVKTGETTSRSLVEAHLARIDDVNPRVNAVVRVLREEALEAADHADRERQQGSAIGPLHGVPFSAKECIDVAGLPTTWGNPALADAVSPGDAPVVERMRAAGAIPIARTNLPDFAFRPSTTSTLYGLTRNPWDYERTAGGSSGGDAAALASGMTPIGLGSDLGGSLRNPANACGIVSVRPSAGRVPCAQLIPGPDQYITSQLMNVHGPMARTVADVRLVLEAIIGAHPKDPWSIDAPLAGKPVRSPIRVAVLSGMPLESAVADAVRGAADALSDAGYAVEEACPPRYEEAIETWSELIIGDQRYRSEEVLPLLGPDELKYFTMHTDAVPAFADSFAMSASFQRRHRIAMDWSAFQDEYPLLLGPTWTRVTPGHGFDLAGDLASLQAIIRPVAPANLLGLPSVCVPSQLDPVTGLPIGVLVGGRRFREDLCLDAAAVIEASGTISTPIEPRF